MLRRRIPQCQLHSGLALTRLLRELSRAGAALYCLDSR